MNHTTGRHPRTLAEAFGPYTSQSIEDNEPAYSLTDKVIVWLGLAACITVPVLSWLGIL